jgi:adenylate kinase family enzyme
LLEQHKLFPPNKNDLALEIILKFIGLKKFEGLILNGFPRTIEQAKLVLDHFDIKTVITLECHHDVVTNRVL